MINRVIEWCLNNRFLVISFVLLLILGGVWALWNTPVDAIPDIGEMQVIVIAEWPGRSPRDVEDQITYPLQTALMGLPKVKTIRASSAFGFSLVNIIFEEGTDYYWARTRVLEKIYQVEADLPEGVTPELGPDATALGQIFWYTVENVYYCPDHPEVTSTREGRCPLDNKKLILARTDLGTLRSLQDWYIKYLLSSVEGISEVASVGGFVREYQIEVDPAKLYSNGISIKKVIDAVKRSNIDVGAKVFEESGMEFIIRGVGFIKSIEDIENIVLKSRDGVPVKIGDVADVVPGPAFRRNALDKEGSETVGGVAIMRYGANPLEVIKRLKKKISEIEAGLPPGIRIIPFYDRTEVINRATHTLKIALIEEMIVASIVLFLFLFHMRSTFIIALIIPLGVLGAFLFMKIIGMTSNIMSLGGIAIAIGVMVDAGIVMTENIHRHLSTGRKKGDGTDRIRTAIDAAKEVGAPIFFAILIIIIAFVPVFALKGQAGKLFRPLAITKTFVMSISALLAISFIPVLSTLLLRGRLRSIEEIPITKNIKMWYRDLLSKAFRYRYIVLIVSLIALVGSFILAGYIPGEFMPPLNEGDLLFMPVLLPGASLSQVKEVMRTQDIIIKSFPEVETVVGKLGRAETATDPAPVAMIETIIKLKPKKFWRKGMTREKLIEEIKEKTAMPGVSPIMTQPIRNRIDMLATGIQTPVGIKIFGEDLKAIEETAVRVEELLREVPGALNPYAERIGNKPYLEIRIDRDRIARYGILLEDVQQTIAAAIGGMEVSWVINGRERYPITVRYPRELRDNDEAIGDILISTADGSQIPLSQVAEIKRTMGPAMIFSENTLPYVRVFVSIDTEKTGLMEFVDNVRKTLDEKIRPSLPHGVYYSIAGQYEYKKESDRRLALLVPVCLFIIFILLYIKFKSVSSTLILATALPFSFIGGAVLQYILGIKFSTAVWVGYIALFGIAVEDGIVMLDYLARQAGSTGDHLVDSFDAASLRVRPILMTTATTILALLPIMFATGTGSEFMIPIAVPTVGGMVTCTLSNLFLVPILYIMVEAGKKRKKL